MTSKTDKFRAVFLAALMVFSVFAGTVALSGSAAAVDADGSATVSPSTIDESTTQQHTFDVSFANYSSDSTNDTFSASAPSGVNVSNVDVTAEASGTQLNVIADNGTWIVQDDGSITNASTINFSVTADATAPSVDSDTNGTFSFDFVDSAGTNGTAAADVTIQNTTSETTDDGTTTASPTATGDADVLSTIHYDNDTGEAVDPIVEVAFSEPVDVENASDMTLYVDGQQVDITSDEVSTNGDGRVTISTDELYTGDVTLNVPDNVADVNGDNNVSVTVATVAVGATGGSSPSDPANVYQGENVAVLGSTPNTDIEVEGDESNYAFSGSTGTNSQVFVFNTTNREIDQYNFSIGQSAPNAAIEVRDLGFNMTVDDQNVTTGDSIEGTVTANAGNRPIEVALLDSDGDEVKEIGATLNGQGEYEFDFNLDNVDTGDYTVRARDNNSGVTDSSSTINVAEAGEGTADFNKSIYTEARGDVVEMNITLDNTDTASATIGSDDVGYLANVTVEDADDDGTVTVLFNTWEARGDGANPGALTVAGEDDLVSSNVPIPVSSLLDSGDYDLEVRAGDNPDAPSQNVATLVLEERQTRGIATWTAPEGTTFENKGDVYEAARNNNLTQAQEPALGDLVVQSVNASGLEGALDAQGNDEVSGQLFGSNVTNFTVVQTAADTNRDPFQLALNESNTAVVADAENDTYFVAYNPSDVLAYVDENDNDEYDPDVDTVASDRFGDEEALTANFTVSGNSELADEQQSVESDYELAGAEYNIEEPVNVTASANQTISGTTTVAPGTELQIRVRSTDDTSPSFLKTTTTYVTENQTYSGTFDFSGQNVNDSFTVTVSGGPSTAETLEAEGNVVEGGAQQNQTETGTAGTQTETTVTETTTAGGQTTTAATTAGGETTTAGADTGTEGTGTGTPGFGIAVAVVALLAAALLAVRRD